MYSLFNLHKERIGLNTVQAINLAFPLLFFSLSALWFGTRPSIEIDVSNGHFSLDVIELIPETAVFISAGMLSSLFFGYLACLAVSVASLPGIARWASKEAIDPGARLIVSRPVSVLAVVVLVALSFLVYVAPLTELRIHGVRNIGRWYLLATWSFGLANIFVADAV